MRRRVCHFPMLLAATLALSSACDVYLQETPHPTASWRTVSATRASTDVYLSWSLPPNAESLHPDCDGAGVVWVDVRVDGQRVGQRPCEDGRSPQLDRAPLHLGPGRHTLELTAADETGYVFYAGEASLALGGQPEVSVDVTLDWAVGGAAVSWRLSQRGTTVSCSQAGVSRIAVNFQDATGRWLYPGAGDIVPCTLRTAVWDFLPPGTWRLYAVATDAWGYTWESAPWSGTVTVEAGRFVDARSALPLVLELQ